MRDCGERNVCAPKKSLCKLLYVITVGPATYFLFNFFKLILAVGIEKLMNRKKVKTKEFFMMIMAALKNLKVLSA